MATIPCPACGLPRAEDLFGVVACPLCGHAGVLAPVREPAETISRPIAAPPRTEPEGSHAPLVRTGSRLAVGVALGFFVGTAAGSGGVFAWQTYRDRLPNAGAVAGANRPPPTCPVTPHCHSFPRRRRCRLAARSPRRATRHHPARNRPRCRGQRAGRGRPRAATGPAEPVPPGRPAGHAGRGRRSTARSSNPAGRLTVRGSVKRLVVNNLDNGAVLDCSELEAREVIVVGKIDGRSRLAVSAPGGTVTFRATVGGGAAVNAKARAVEFRGRIDGAGTKVAVTLTAGGTLAFAEIDGPARLEYATADPADPAPVVARGKVGGQAVFTKVE